MFNMKPFDLPIGEKMKKFLSVLGAVFVVGAWVYMSDDDLAQQEAYQAKLAALEKAEAHYKAVSLFRSGMLDDAESMDCPIKTKGGNCEHN